MLSNFERCCHFREGSTVLVINYANNVWLVKMAVLKIYGHSEYDIQYFESKNNSPYQVFDGEIIISPYEKLKMSWFSCLGNFYYLNIGESCYDERTISFFKEFY